MEIVNLALKRKFYAGLNEHQRRHFAALEARSLGYGGIKLISETFGIDPTTIRTAMKELESDEEFRADRERRPGGGRKKS